MINNSSISYTQTFDADNSDCEHAKLNGSQILGIRDGYALYYLYDSRHIGLSNDNKFDYKSRFSLNTCVYATHYIDNKDDKYTGLIRRHALWLYGCSIYCEFSSTFTLSRCSFISHLVISPFEKCQIPICILLRSSRNQKRLTEERILHLSSPRLNILAIQ